jgi:hypothetical protein
MFQEKRMKGVEWMYLAQDMGSGGVFWTCQWTVGLYRIRKMNWLSQKLLAYQEDSNIWNSWVSYLVSQSVSQLDLCKLQCCLLCSLTALSPSVFQTATWQLSVCLSVSQSIQTSVHVVDLHEIGTPTVPSTSLPLHHSLHNAALQQTAWTSCW